MKERRRDPFGLRRLILCLLTSIFGGAADPTSVLVATATARYGVIVAAAIVVIVAIVGIYKTERNS